MLEICIVRQGSVTCVLCLSFPADRPTDSMQVKAIYVVSLATLTAFLTLAFLYELQINDAIQAVESYEWPSSHLYVFERVNRKLYIIESNERKNEIVTSSLSNSSTVETNVQEEEANIISNSRQNMKSNVTIPGQDFLRKGLGLFSPTSKDNHSLHTVEKDVQGEEVDVITNSHHDMETNVTTLDKDPPKEGLGLSLLRSKDSLHTAESNVQKAKANKIIINSRHNMANVSIPSNSFHKTVQNLSSSPSKGRHILSIRAKILNEDYATLPWHLPNCSLEHWRTYPSVKNKTAYELELQMVYRNLDKCLEGADLTGHFGSQDYLETARENAKTFLSTIRKVVPTHFSHHYSAPCWDSKLSVRYCEEDVPQLDHKRMRRVEGSVNEFVFKTSLDLFEYELKTEIRTKVNITSPTLCLPTLFIAGFPKCGSTQVYCLVTNLAKLANPSYNLSSTALGKEPHWWVPHGPHSSSYVPHQPTRLVGYLMNFIGTATVQRNSRFALPIIDGSPNLIFQWQRYSPTENLENYCLVPAVLPQILPNSKYIVVMRNPADMLYSAFWFSCSAGHLKLNRAQQLWGPHIFHEKVEKKIMMFKNCTTTRPVDNCLIDVYPLITSSFGACGRVRLEVGFYYHYIRRWLSVVPTRQFFFLTTEELHDNVTYIHVANKISEFLGLGVHIESVETLQHISRQQTECSNIQSRYDYHHDTELQMRNDTRKLLNDFFKPYNQKLAELLGDKKYLWQPSE